MNQLLGFGSFCLTCMRTGILILLQSQNSFPQDFITSSAAKFSAYLTYHSYGQYLLYPWGYENAVPPDYKDLDEVGKTMAEVKMHF